MHCVKTWLEKMSTYYFEKKIIACIFIQKLACIAYNILNKTNYIMFRYIFFSSFCLLSLIPPEFPFKFTY